MKSEQDILNEIDDVLKHSAPVDMQPNNQPELFPSDDVGAKRYSKPTRDQVKWLRSVLAFLEVNGTDNLEYQYNMVMRDIENYNLAAMQMTLRHNKERARKERMAAEKRDLSEHYNIAQRRKQKVILEYILND